MDVLIAAAAVAAGVRLVTRTQTDLSRVTGIELVDYQTALRVADDRGAWAGG